MKVGSIRLLGPAWLKALKAKETLRVSSADLRPAWQDPLARQENGLQRKPLGSVPRPMRGDPAIPHTGQDCNKVTVTSPIPNPKSANASGLESLPLRASLFHPRLVNLPAMETLRVFPANLHPGQQDPLARLEECLQRKPLGSVPRARTNRKAQQRNHPRIFNE
jgi:hypothetical protein